MQSIRLHCPADRENPRDAKVIAGTASFEAGGDTLLVIVDDWDDGSFVSPAFVMAVWNAKQHRYEPIAKKACSRFSLGFDLSGLTPYTIFDRARKLR